MPQRLQDVILLRLDQLSPGARHVMAAAATVGGSIDHQLLAAACGQDDAAFDRAVAEVVDHTLLVVDAAHSLYEFRHALAATRSSSRSCQVRGPSFIDGGDVPR